MLREERDKGGVKKGMKQEKREIEKEKVRSEGGNRREVERKE